MKQEYISITTEALREVEEAGPLTAAQAGQAMVTMMDEQMKSEDPLTPAAVRASLISNIAYSLLIVGHIDAGTFQPDELL